MLHFDNLNKPTPFTVNGVLL